MIKLSLKNIRGAQDRNYLLLIGIRPMITLLRFQD